MVISLQYLHFWETRFFADTMQMDEKQNPMESGEIYIADIH